MTTTKYLNDKAQPSRRTMLKTMGAGAAAALAMPHVARAQSAGTIKVGFVTPATGLLSLFGETDGFTVSRVEKLLESGLKTAAGTYDVEILARDGQSNPNKAAEIAGDLILNEEVHIIIPASTTDTINPVAERQSFMKRRAFQPQPRGRQWSFHAAVTKNRLNGPTTSSGALMRY